MIATLHISDADARELARLDLLGCCPVGEGFSRLCAATAERFARVGLVRVFGGRDACITPAARRLLVERGLAAGRKYRAARMVFVA